MIRYLLIHGLFFFSFITYSQSGTTITDSIFSNGVYRSYRLYIPANYTGNNSVPLILNLHGYTSNATQQQLYSNFMPIADTAGFLMVYPQGTTDSYGNPFWNAGTVPVTAVNDTLFLNQLIDSLKLTYNIDLNRVYMTGLSNGGFMSHYMACFCNRKIKAIASVAGTFFTFWPNCNPGKTIPVMHIHGTADPTVPYYGNSSMTGADTTINRWIAKNNCNTTPTYSAVPNTNTTDGSTAEHYQYFITGNNKSIVEFFKINNGAHTWPGSPFVIGTTNQDINASAEIWRFFNQFTANDFSTDIQENISTQNVLIYPNPVSSEFIVHSAIPIQLIEIKDICEKTVWQQKFMDTNFQVKVNIESFEDGIYFVNINHQLTEKLILKHHQ